MKHVLLVVASVLMAAMSGPVTAQAVAVTEKPAPGVIDTQSGTGVDKDAYNALIDKMDQGDACGEDCDRIARLVSGNAPVMPYDADGQTPVTGEVAIIFIIDESGLTSNFRIERSTSPQLSAAAIAAVQSWRFTPALKAGKPVSMQARQIFPFVLP
ncbi:energy transducer TonB [Stenotrophomonas panacihumi]|uniref:energy transducer TonB n=1 Tax=Stenotrophomonas panacihumi TaxID=676599 RepID=UPI0009D6DBED|nr:energy transducer TonB [Stenotrophomonas panacihumi]PTN54143.1 hypothetical protein C9J98_11615 [Stenotrophomonas panacihumi]